MQRLWELTDAAARAHVTAQRAPKQVPQVPPAQPTHPGPQGIRAAPRRFPAASVEGAWAPSPALNAWARLARTVLAPVGVSVPSPDDTLTLLGHS